jgi:glutamine amidotransferase
MIKDIIIVDYGVGNIKSLSFAFERLGVRPVLSKDPTVIKSAEKVIFPGVGNAIQAVSALQNSGLSTLVKELEQPTLGICLGMQLMALKTEEGDQAGLGIFQEEVLRFPDTEIVPHMGWNQIQNLQSPLFKGLKGGEYVYFVHSYYLPSNAETIATTNYGQNFSAAVQKGNFFGVQFHPEKSQRVGEIILKNFLEL